MSLKQRLLGFAVMAAFCMPRPSLSSESNNKLDTFASCDTSKDQVIVYADFRACGATGSQIALFANISKGSVRGSQASLLANVSLDTVEGTQLSGVMNLARDVRHQLFASLNMAHHVRSQQFGGINIADTVDGSQIGYLNIAHHLDGYSLGLLTVADNGLLHVDVSVEETGMEKLSFASGKRFFTAYSLGYTIDDAGHPYSFGIGFGYHQEVGPLYAEGELDGSLVLDKETRIRHIGETDHRPGDTQWRNNTLFQSKLRLGGNLFGGLGVFGGISYNLQAFKGNERLMHSWSEDFTGSSENLAWWPGLEFGIRLGR